MAPENRVWWVASGSSDLANLMILSTSRGEERSCTTFASSPHIWHCQDMARNDRSTCASSPWHGDPAGERGARSCAGRRVSGAAGG